MTSLGDSIGKLILRFTLGIFLLFHGIAKISAPVTLEFIQNQLITLRLPEILAYGVFIGEVVAPLMLILGIFTRLGGVLIVFNMLFAIMLVHRAEILNISTGGGWALELQGFYLLSGLVVFFLGSGRFAFRPD